MPQHTINTLLHFPPRFELLPGCEISIKVQDISDRNAPKLHSQWGSNHLSSTLPINFPVVIDSEVNEVGSRFSINVKISFLDSQLLLDLDQTFWWGGGDHDTDIYLSTVSHIAVFKSWMPQIGYPADSKLFVKLVELNDDGQPGAVIDEAVGLTAQTTPIYLKYNPFKIWPGQEYALIGSFEGYGQKVLALGLKPGKLILQPQIEQTPIFGD